MLHIIGMLWCLVLCDDPEEWDEGAGLGGRFQREEVYVYLMADSHCCTTQKPAQRCEAIILQWKVNLRKKERDSVSYLLSLPLKMLYPPYHLIPISLIIIFLVHILCINLTVQLGIKEIIFEGW